MGKTSTTTAQDIPSHPSAGGIERFTTCSRDNCKRPSVRGQSCSTCQSHLCAIHRLRQYHTCPSRDLLDDEAWEANVHKEVRNLVDLIDIPALTRKASSLRHGVSCVHEAGKYLGDGAIMGCANYHSWIIFEDGVKWLARIPRVTEFSDVPTQLIEYLVESEYATLKFVETLDIPTPRAHGFGLASDPKNDVGVSYILEDAMPGQPFKPHQATANKKARVYSQYADILIELSRHLLKQACSLLFKEDGIVPGPIASDRTISLAQHGPYATTLDYFKSIANHQVDLIADGQLHPDIPKEAFLLYHLLASRAAPALDKGPGGFFLKHVDDKGDHILVDTDFNITAVIDWQFARSTPVGEAFGPSLLTANLNNLYSGSAGSSEDDLLLTDMLRKKGREDIAEIAGGSELTRRFHFGVPSGFMDSEVLPLVRAILSILHEQKMDDEETKEWMEREWERLSNDPRRQKTTQLLREQADD